MISRPHGSSVRRPSIGITTDLVTAAEGVAPRYELKAAYPALKDIAA